MSSMTENWCRFILNEGFMPSFITRKLKDFPADHQDLCLIIADILSNSENKSIDSNFVPDRKNIKAAFKTDPELQNWLETMQELINIIKTYATKGEIFSNIVDEACLSFIKACPLVADNRKKLYIGLKYDSYPNLFANSNVKQAFRKYLENEHYSPNTINSYISGVNKVGKLTNIQRNLWEIRDADEMWDLIAHWEKNTNHLYEEYKERDFLSRKTLSNAVKRYADFLKQTNFLKQTKGE